MSDSQYETFQHYGTAAERGAFVPDPSAATGVQPIYLWYETDTSKTYLYDTSWHQIASASSGIPAVVQGDLLYGSAANTLSALAKNATATRYLSNTGATNNPAWAQVVLTDGVSGILPVANGGSGSASGATILKASGTINNATYLTLPTLGGSLITAPGAGFAINFIIGWFVADFTAGAYTGAAAGGSSLQLQIGAVAVSNYLANDNTATPALSYLSTFNNNTKKRVIFVPNTDTTDENAGWGNIVPVTTNYTGDATALTIGASNGGVNFGGGNGSNHVNWTILYTLESTT